MPTPKELEVELVEPCIGYVAQKDYLSEISSFIIILATFYFWIIFLFATGVRLANT